MVVEKERFQKANNEKRLNAKYMQMMYLEYSTHKLVLVSVAVAKSTCGIYLFFVRLESKHNQRLRNREKLFPMFISFVEHYALRGTNASGCRIIFLGLFLASDVLTLVRDDRFRTNKG